MSVARLEDLKISGSPPHPLLDNSVICLDICDKVKFVVATDLWIEMLSSNSLDGALSYDGAVHPLVLAKTHCILNFDQQLLYTSFFADFGPLDLGLTVSFCNEMGKALDKASKMGKLDGVVYYSSRNPQRVSIDIVLLATYLLVTKGYTAERAYQPFYDNLSLQKYVVPFRDAAFSINTYPITVIDCIKGVYRAILNKHFDYASFDLFRFKELSQLQNGDISWIIPNKYIAFSGPTTVRREVSAGVRTLAPEEYVPVFKRLGVKMVVRFNSKCYDKNVFTANGIKHVDLYYEDGANPTNEILQSFLQISETEKGVIAVHCKAGLGRTGTNIAAYMMKHHGYTAKEAIAWIKICRPGSVVGPQNIFLSCLEVKMSQPSGGKSKALKR